MMDFVVLFGGGAVLGFMLGFIARYLYEIYNN